MDIVTIALYVTAAAVILLLARGLWILKKSGDARIERLQAQVKAREGRNPEDAQTYHQDVEAKAMAYLRKVPLLRRVPLIKLTNRRE